MPPTKYSFKRHQELEHKPTASPVFHRHRGPLPAPTALTGLAQPESGSDLGLGDSRAPSVPARIHPGACSHQSTAPAPTATASGPFLQLHLRSPQGHRCSCALFWEAKTGASQAAVEEDKGVRAAGAGAQTPSSLRGREEIV